MSGRFICIIMMISFVQINLKILNNLRRSFCCSSISEESAHAILLLFFSRRLSTCCEIPIRLRDADTSGSDHESSSSDSALAMLWLPRALVSNAAWLGRFRDELFDCYIYYNTLLFVHYHLNFLKTYNPYP